MSIVLAPPHLLSHPAFVGLDAGYHSTPAGYFTNGIGQRINSKFDHTWAPIPELHRNRVEHQDLPWSWLHEEVYEWIALAEAIRDAAKTFTMVELGAGYGRWLVAGARLARQLRPELSIKLVGVEADPVHFGWMREHFADNELNPDDHDLICAAIDADAGRVPFCSAPDPSLTYGQHVEIEAFDDPLHSETVEVNAIGINDLLGRYDRVDLIDVDIQGHERVIVPAGITNMTRQVRRVYAGIHEPEAVGLELIDLFTSHGWTSACIFPFKSTIETEFGQISFTDGAQYWLNPHCER